MSDKIEWSDDLLVHVAAIDDDHRKLFALMNEIFASAHHGAGAIHKAIGDLCSYTKHHFATEQDSMARSGYGELAAHKYEHEHLVFQLETLIERLMVSGPEAVDDDLAQFLKDWLCNHIMTFDVKYAAYLRQSGQAG